METIQLKPATLSPKEVLIALCNYPTYLKMIKSKGKLCAKLHKWLLDISDSISGNEINIPSIEEIANQLHTTSRKVSSSLQKIYHEFFLMNVVNSKLFVKTGQKQCYLSFNNHEKYAEFNLGLEAIPREGEAFYFQFVKPINGGHIFYVRLIYHYCDKGEHLFLIFLEAYEPPSTGMQLKNIKAPIQRTPLKAITKTNSSTKEELVKQ